MEENVDNSLEAFGAILGLVILGSCANMPYYQAKKEFEKNLPKIEQRQKIATNQVHRISPTYFIKVR